ncbi:MAG: hypothetical protein ACFFDT_05725 [Candidatus Hodarchaeota archaeon]
MGKPRNVILKLGGSAITRKKDISVKEDLLRLLGLKEECDLNIRELFSCIDKFFNWEILYAIESQLVEVYENVDRLIILHGAGPFGHSVVSHFLSAHKSEQDNIGWPLTILSVTLQNQMIVGWLQGIGIPAISMPPHAMYIGKEAPSPGAITFSDATCDISILENMLYRRYVPVLYGDMIIDTTGQYRVLSGDTLLPILVRELDKVDLVLAGTIFDPELTDKEVGVYTLDPAKYDNTHLIKQVIVPKVGSPRFDLEDGRKLSIDQLKAEMDKIRASVNRDVSKQSDDVTGEMLGKLEDFIQCAQYGISGYVVNIHRLSDTVLGKIKTGTKIIPETNSLL